MNPLNLPNSQQLHHISNLSNLDEPSKVTVIAMAVFKFLPFVALGLSTLLLFRCINHAKKSPEVFPVPKEEQSDESISFEKISAEKSFDAYSGSTSDDDEDSSIESCGNTI